MKIYLKYCFHLKKATYLAIYLSVFCFVFSQSEIVIQPNGSYKESGYCEPGHYFPLSPS